ncbi:Trk system potassium transporter TrkA [Aliikangiella coralliicola]|uniref:Trk system potassium uptake protein TrkA n=1 Tax=Aliikangiella coralliicola TaxID=2592383 RepID=A0A545UGP2_9GAMM|nr:Trk system potassium transporter TrkA [Aliikangiella coralliicola]TQV88630.1 Trk system potassium transporter TrkA [Aliikangiella coralliicola]
MKIIILGAGQVGGTLAISLAGEDNDITLVDTNPKKLRALQDHLDLRTIVGYGAHPQILRQAGAEDADMVIAVTNSDETNMIACQVAYSIFNTPTKIARVRSAEYLKEKKLFDAKNLPVDVVISPEQLVVKYIRRLVENPGALQVVDFADGLVRLVAVKAYYGGLLVGNALSALKDHMPNIETRVAAIFRRGRAIMPTGDTVIEADDEVFFIAASHHIRQVMGELQKLENPYKRIMIAGGGNIGQGLAKSLEDTYHVKLLEADPKKAHSISDGLENTIVLQGDASNQELLLDENIDHMDVFIAVTNKDEANIMSAMLAKKLGVRKTMVLINRTAYIDLLQGNEVDIAISPQQTTTSSLLTHIRRGDVANVYTLRRGAAEAMEAVAHGTEETSKVVGRAIGDIELPRGTTIAAIVRDDKVIIAHHNIVIQSNDHVILFLVGKKYVRDVEQLFQVDLTFF